MDVLLAKLRQIIYPMASQSIAEPGGHRAMSNEDQHKNTNGVLIDVESWMQKATTPLAPPM